MAIPNLIQCGGIGDNATDNAAALATFLDQASRAGIGFIPPGAFRYSSGFRIDWSIGQPTMAGGGMAGLRLYGSGPFSTCLCYTGDGDNAMSFIGAPGQGDALVLEGFQLLPPGGNQVSAIALFSNSRARLRDIWTYGGENGLWITNSFAVDINALKIVATEGDSGAIAFDGDNSANNTTIRGCSLFANAGPAISIPNATTVLIDGNDIEGNGAGWSINAQSGSVRGNHCERNNGGYSIGGGIAVAPTDNFIADA